jgi:hypothetical protein
MSRWSGIGPTVDAHLKRWNDAGKAKQLVERVLDTRGNDENAVQNMMDTQYGLRWITFGLTYGHPDADGVPRISQYAVDQLAIEGTTIVGRERFEGGQREAFQGALLAFREWQMLSHATSHYISAEVVDEVTLAAEQAENEPLYETDLFDPCGFAVLEKPLIVSDMDPDTGVTRDDLKLWIRAIGWQRHDGILNPKTGVIQEGISLFMYTTPDDYREGYVASMLAAGLRVNGFDEHGIETDPYDDPAMFLQVDVVPWAFNSTWGIRDAAEWIPGTVPSPVGYERRWFYAFMRLCWQQIIVRHRPDTDRAQRRRWEHMAKRKELLDYTILRLRRYVDPFYVASGQGAPLDHRVKVRAHWRYQYIPGLGPARLPDGTANPENHRWLWIESYWKGPDDGQIGAMHPATSVTR